MWWGTSVRPGTTRLTPDEVCPSSLLQGRAALAPATASVLRNDLRDAPESSGATFTLPKSLELSGLLQKRFRLGAPWFQCLCWICGARYHSAADPQPKMFRALQACRRRVVQRSRTFFFRCPSLTFSGKPSVPSVAFLRVLCVKF